ncbi:hypothetical protein K438DRAFT_1767237 [Mycena galopus ATCC 62051]|nr:hypothetical protein K438DRAFT_1767237 [Mycena galopus ATCC 62051]
MSSSNALIPWDPHASTAVATIPENSRPEGGKWVLLLNALLSPSPGRTLDRVYTSIGNVLETQANRAAYTFGLGPHVAAGKIQAHFGDGEERVRQLELLRISAAETRDEMLEAHEIHLTVWFLSTEAVNTQCQAFKEIVDLVAIFPGLRVLFLHTKPLANTSALDAISALWDRSTGAPDKEWTFLANFSGNLLNRDLNFGRTGVLALPVFWLDLGTIHGHIANKLCCRLVRVLKDIGVDIPALGPVDESEIHLTTMVSTFLLPHYFTEFQAGLQKSNSKIGLCNCGMKALSELFSYCAREIFKMQIPFKLIFYSQNTTSHEQPSHEDNNLWDLQCENTSTSSFHSSTSNQDHNQNVESVNEVESQLSERDSVQLSEDDESLRMSDLNANVSAAESGSTASADKSQNPENPSLQQIVHELNPTLYPSFADRQKEADEWRTTLHQRHSDLGENHLDTLNAMNSLALVQYGLGEYKSARDLQAVVLEKRIILLGNDPLTLDTMQCLGITYNALGQYREAEGLLLSVVDRRKEVLGEYHPETLGAMIQLARVYWNLGQRKCAEDLQILALEKQRGFFGEENDDTATAIRDLAIIYHNQGHHKEAKKLYPSALEKYRRILGGDHPETLVTMGALGENYRALGQPEEAKHLCWTVLEKRRKLFREHHPDTLKSMSDLAVAYNDLGQLENAQGLLVVAWKKLREHLGEDHQDTLITMGRLVATYNQLGWFDIAEEIALGALEKRRKALGEDHPNTLWIMGNLAKTYQMQGRFEHGEEMYVVLFEKRRKLLGNDHPATKWTMENLAWTYHALGKIQVAEELERLPEVKSTRHEN